MIEFARHTPNPERRGLEPGEVGKQEAETTVSILYCADNNRPIAQSFMKGTYVSI